MFRIAMTFHKISNFTKPPKLGLHGFDPRRSLQNLEKNIKGQS
jgi:hypothetical protein